MVWTKFTKSEQIFVKILDEMFTETDLNRRFMRIDYQKLLRIAFGLHISINLNLYNLEILNLKLLN